jgi:hypothetical protein
MSPGETSALGALLAVPPDSPAALLAVGLHHSDRRWGNATLALRVARPGVGRKKVVDRYRQPPPPATPLPDFAGDSLTAWAGDLSSTRQAAVGRLADDIATLPNWNLKAALFERWAARRDDAVCSTKLLAFTLVLRGLNEPLVSTIQHAYLLGISLHDDWRKASQEWLTPYARTWARDFVVQFPALACLAKEACEAGLDNVPNYMFPISPGG